MSKLLLGAIILQTLLLSALFASDGNSQNMLKANEVYISVNLKGASLVEVFNLIESKTEFTFSYEKKDLEENVKINLISEKQSVADILRQVARVAKLKFKQVNNNINVRKMEVDSRQSYEIEVIPSVDKTLQEKTISGRVTDEETGESLPGVNILAKGTSSGTVTNMEGSYTLTVNDEVETLVFSFIGYLAQEVPIGGRSTINVSLSPDVKSLEEIVVVGYGTQERAEITGSIASVSSEAITSVPVSGVQEALQGRVAGVNITQASGAPGGGVDVNIRGIATFGSGNPLFVIDGVPILAGDGGGSIRSERGNTSGGNINPLATLNLNAIESVQILKDASAAAIYGARAANGVVIITTKGGTRGGKPKFSLNVSGGVSVVPERNFIPMMNSEQYIDYATEAYQNAGASIPTAFQEPRLSDNLTRNTNWQDEAFNQGRSQNYAFSASGGGENATYAFHGGYLEENGTLPNSTFKKYSARINTNFDISDKLRIGESLEISRGVWTGLFDPAHDYLQEVLQGSPTMPHRDPSNLGGFAGPDLKYSPINRSNRIGMLEVIDDNNTHNRLLGRVYAEYEFFPGLAYRLNVGGDILFTNSKIFTPVYEMNNRSNITANLIENRYTDNTFLVENTLTYRTTINDVHKITALAGFSQQESWNSVIQGSISQFPSNDLRTIASGTGPFSISGDESGWALRSLIGRLNYTYDNRYNLMATIRRDGSSRFGANNPYGVFPSLSGSWNISNESFMDNINAISDLRLRASWGQVGSQDISNFAAYTTLQSDIFYILGQGQQLASGSAFTQMGNPDLKWETTTQTNIGLDIGLLNDRLSLVMDYYIKETNDILVQLPIATSSGIARNNGAFQNAGSLLNKGFEFAANYQDNIGKLSYLISGNFSTNQNEVTALGSGRPILTRRTSDPHYITTYTHVGGELGAFYGYIYDGVFRDEADLEGHANQPGAAPGDAKFRDLNNDGEINSDDQTIIGSPFPDFTYGFNTNLSYSNFDLTIFLQGKQGHDVYNLLWAGINDGTGNNNATTEMLNRWTPNNRDTNIPRAILGDPNQNTRPSTRFVEDGSYLRIQNIQLGYTLGPNLLSRLGSLSRARFYASARNLFTFTNYRSFNPEVGRLTSGPESSLVRNVDMGVYPIPRMIEVGVQVTFN